MVERFTDPTDGPNWCCKITNSNFLGFTELGGEEILKEQCLTCGTKWEYDIVLLLRDEFDE